MLLSLNIIKHHVFFYGFILDYVLVCTYEREREMVYFASSFYIFLKYVKIRVTFKYVL